MTREEFSNWLETAERTEYVIFIKARYKGDNWEEYREYFYYDNNYNTWVWENDWDEGQDEVDIYGYMSLDKMEEYYVLSRK